MPRHNPIVLERLDSSTKEHIIGIDNEDKQYTKGTNIVIM